MQQKSISPLLFFISLLSCIVTQAFSLAYGQPGPSIGVDSQNVDNIQIEVLDQFPAAASSGITISNNNPFYLRLGYLSSTAIRIYAQPVQAGNDASTRTSGSPLLPAGENEALVWVALASVGTVDSINLSYVVDRSGNEQILYANIPINAAWASDGVNTLSNQPPWVTDLLALSEQRRDTSISNSPQSSLLWNLFISVLVLLVSGSIVALCVAAMRQWQNYWRAMAGAPLVILLIWVAVIVLSIIVQPDSHSLWPFEIFAWSMGTAVYMMLLLTAKKTFIKADQEKAGRT